MAEYAATTATVGGLGVGLGSEDTPRDSDVILQEFNEKCATVGGLDDFAQGPLRAAPPSYMQMQAGAVAPELAGVVA